MQYDLVCDDTLLISLISTIYLFGVLIGAPLSGVLSDRCLTKQEIPSLTHNLRMSPCCRFGRKLVLLVGSGGHLVVALAAAFSPNYATFAVLRFFLSIFSTFAYLTAFVIGATELLLQQ